MLLRIAAQYVEGRLTGVDWWPALITSRRRNDKIYKLSLLEPSVHILSFLQTYEPSLKPERYIVQAIAYLTDYVAGGYTDKKKYLLALMMLMASKTNLLTSIMQYMSDAGVQLGAFNGED
jgi:hypothetical protein